MSKADKIFEELGYRQIIEGTVINQYEKTGFIMEKEIIFDLLNKYIFVEKSCGDSTYITMRELQAINLKRKTSY